MRQIQVLYSQGGSEIIKFFLDKSLTSILQQCLATYQGCWIYWLYCDGEFSAWTKKFTELTLKILQGLVQLLWGMQAHLYHLYSLHNSHKFLLCMWWFDLGMFDIRQCRDADSGYHPPIQKCLCLWTIIIHANGLLWAWEFLRHWDLELQWLNIALRKSNWIRLSISGCDKNLREQKMGAAPFSRLERHNGLYSLDFNEDIKNWQDAQWHNKSQNSILSDLKHADFELCKQKLRWNLNLWVQSYIWLQKFLGNERIALKFAKQEKAVCLHLIQVLRIRFRYPERNFAFGL